MLKLGEVATEFVGFGAAKVSLWEEADNSIDQDDIVQGRLGDCYFLAAVADVAGCESDGTDGAESDPLVKDLIVEEGADVGVFGVKFYVMGKWTTVVIDDLFPCYESGGRVALCGSQLSSQGEMWVAILEKAFAKLHGCYEALEGGHCDDALNYLCGGHVEKFELSTTNEAELDDVWRRLEHEAPLAHPDRAAFLTCALKPGIGADDAKARGLFTGHAYSLLGVLETSAGLRLLKLRNPHGGTEWSGAYSDGSAEWTAALKAEVEGLMHHELQDSDDGSFFMELTDFRQWVAEVISY